MIQKNIKKYSAFFEKGWGDRGKGKTFFLVKKRFTLPPVLSFFILNAELFEFLEIFGSGEFEVFFVFFYYEDVETCVPHD